jgi:hypothetical protein
MTCALVARSGIPACHTVNANFCAVRKDQRCEQLRCSGTTVKTRTLTVSTTCQRRPNGRLVCVPSIRLIGKWLEDAGFAESDRVFVKVRQNRISLRRVAAAPSSPKKPPLGARVET